MYTSRPLLKNNARIIIRTARPSLITAGLILVAVSFLFSMLSGSVLGVNMTAEDIRQYMNYYANGDFQALLRLSERMAPPSSAYLINALIQVVLYIFSAGFLIFILNTVKSAGAVYGNLLDGFALAGKLVLLALLESLFIFLWSLLFFIPGIIAAYRYRMAKFLLLDHPEMGRRAALHRLRGLGLDGPLHQHDLRPLLHGPCGQGRDGRPGAGPDFVSVSAGPPLPDPLRRAAKGSRKKK